MKYILLILLALSARSFSLPGEWMPNAKKIEAIIVEGDDNGRALILLEGGVPQAYIPSACNSPYNTIHLNTEKGKAIYAMALAAYSVGNSVRLALSCTGERPLITHIWLQN